VKPFQSSFLFGQQRIEFVPSRRANSRVVRTELTEYLPKPFVVVRRPRWSGRHLSDKEDLRQVNNREAVCGHQIEQPAAIGFRPIGCAEQHPASVDLSADFWGR